MAEIREVVITIKGDVEKSQAVETDSNQKVKKTDNLGQVTSILLNQAFENVKNELISEVNYEINKHFNLTDDYIGQRKLNVAKNVVSRATGIIATIGASAKIGSVAGPVGTIVGAVVGTTIAGVQLGVDIYQNYDQANIHLRQMEAQLNYTRQRVGYSLTSGSIGDNK